MNRNQRRMAAYNARKAAEQIQQRNFEHRIVRLLSTGNERVEAALSGPSVREVEIESGSVCLPNTAIFSAGHRKPTKSIYQAR